MTTMPLLLVAVMVVMFSVGVYLLLDRSLTRLLLGFLLVGNATNLLIFLMSGQFGAAPLADEASAEEMSDPLPQAFILTAIVITFSISAFLLALIYRSWRLARDRDDTVQDDEDDIDLSTTGALTTIEVMDVDLEEARELSESNDDESLSVGQSEQRAADASLSEETDVPVRTRRKLEGRMTGPIDVGPQASDEGSEER